MYYYKKYPEKCYIEIECISCYKKHKKYKYIMRRKNYTGLCAVCSSRINQKKSAKSFIGRLRPLGVRLKISKGRKERFKRLGFLNSEETRKRMSIALKGKIGYWKNKIRSQDTIDKIRKNRIGKCLGKDNPSWKGGITKNYTLYRKQYDYLRQGAGSLALETLQRIYEDNIKKYGTLTCYLCEHPIQFKQDHLEHKIPISRGGTNQYENLGIACKKCNLSKHDKTPEEFLQYKLSKNKKLEMDEMSR